jgi:hypothetical protein
VEISGKLQYMNHILNRRPRGIMLVVALLTAVVVLMFLGAALKLVPSQLNETVHSREKAAADAAARSGVAYALSRLQEDVSWRANSVAKVVVDTPQLKITEDLGNVVGHLVAADGTKSEFQIRFNYQNGSSQTGDWQDGFDDPGQLYLYGAISQNNLSENSAADVPAPVTSSFGSSSAVTAASAVATSAPRYSCLLQVVGLSGRGVTGVGVSSRTNSVSSDAMVVFTRAEMNASDSVGYFGGGLTANLTGVDGAGGTEGILSLDSVDARPAKLRTVKDVSVGGQLAAKSGSEVVLGTTGTLTQATLTSSVQTSHQSAQQQKEKWPRTKWSDITKAGPSDSHLAPGTYIWRRDPSTKEYVIDHYSEAVVGSTVPATTPTTYTESGFNLHFPPSVRMDAAHLTLEFKDKVYIDPTASLDSLRITYDDTVALAGLRPLNNFSGAAGKTAILSAKGDIALDGVSRGKGSVTTEKSIQFQSSSVFEADPDSAVAIYAKGDVNLTPPSGAQTAPFNEYIAQGAVSTALTLANAANVGTLSTADATSDALADLAPVGPTFISNQYSSAVNPGVAWSTAVPALNFAASASGFSLNAVPTYTSLFQPLNTALSGLSVGWTQTGGYTINPPTVNYTASSLKSFSISKTVQALSFDSTGQSSTHTITSPLMLQALKIAPTFPLTSNDIGFSGLIYAEGNLNANVPNANLFFNGILCLWGGDSNADPGSGGTGLGTINCMNTYFNYDPSCLLKKPGTLLAGQLDQTYFSLK